jgi:hypothetical protein
VTAGIFNTRPKELDAMTDILGEARKHLVDFLKDKQQTNASES